MTDTETKRQEWQRRESDVFLAIDRERVNQRNSTIAVMTAALTGLIASAWWMSIKAAEEVSGPIATEVKVLNERTSAIEARFERFESKQDKVINLLLELKNK